MVVLFDRNEARLLLENHGHAHSVDHTWRYLTSKLRTEELIKKEQKPVTLWKIGPLRYILAEDLARFISYVTPKGQLTEPEVYDITPTMRKGIEMARDKFRSICEERDIPIDEDFIEEMFRFD